MHYTGVMTTKKSTTLKKTTHVKAAKTQPTSKKSTKKVPAVKSLKLSKSQTPFMTLSPSRQSLYWLILGVVVICFTAWILKLQADIDSLYNSIETNSSMVVDPAYPKHKTKE